MIRYIGEILIPALENTEADRHFLTRNALALPRSHFSKRRSGVEFPPGKAVRHSGFSAGRRGARAVAERVGKPNQLDAVEMMAIRILLVDDHRLIRASLKSLLGDFPGIEVVAEAEDGREAFEKTAEFRPDVILMDISMTGLNGLEATRQIVKDHPQTRVVFLSMHTDERYVLQALRAGASGYVLKSAAPSELEFAVGAVTRGEIFLSPAISKHVIDAYLGQSKGDVGELDKLTPRQREILQLIAEGNSSKQIAYLLNASVKTIESHRAGLMERLDIHEVAGLVRYAIRTGLVSPDL